MVNEVPSRIRIRLYVTPSDQGGRTAPVFDGYHGAFWWGELDHSGLRCTYIARLDLEGTACAAPGEVAYAALQPGSPEYWRQVAVGSRLDMCEGARTVGIADVLEIL